MLKELTIIVLTIGLPMFFIMNLGEQTTTGAIANEGAQARMERMQLYLAFPVPFSPVHKRLAEDIRKYLRAGSDEEYYYIDRLSYGEKFFDNERWLFEKLLQGACLKPYTLGIPNGRFVSPGGMNIVMPDNKFFDASFESIGVIPCDENIRQHSENSIARIIQIDLWWVTKTVETSNCPEKATNSLQLAQDNIQYGNLQAVLTNLYVAWSQATNCA